MRPRVFLQHHVILADRVRFLLRSQRHLRRSRNLSRPPSLLSRHGCLSSAPLTSSLLPPINNRLPRLLPCLLPCLLASLLTWLSGRLLSRPPPRPVLPRIHPRRYVVLRIRRLLQNNRSPRPFPPLPRPPTTGSRASPTRPNSTYTGPTRTRSAWTDST
ncbi:hypothetical protein EV650_5201 [Kribbella kalugense]|uniref:Uncharacterized protein n=1 Tax=Kribbella kalugense TaxID=2512221 RepID=A0A4R7ZPX5_9ACTN|nr:hypothetical protein EV650_5201 [Kribbella kalugense]